MRIVIAPDSFKGSLSSLEAAQAMERGVKRVLPQSETVLIPLSDGGDGLLASLVSGRGGRVCEYEVTGPLGRPVSAQLGLLEEGRTAVIEMAQASGLTLVPPNKMNPLVTTSYGTGELIKYGLDLGCTRFIVGLGGSATNDGGLGMGQALGFSFLDQEGKPLGFGGGELVRLAKIETGGADLRLSQADFEVAADVQNVLTGPTGASYVYGPQKGGTPAQLELLDGALENYGRILKRDLGRDVAAKPGAGAAGGLGAGLMALLNAEIRSGIELILDLFDFSQKARGAQLVLTGEGRLDAQSAYGKVPLGVGRRCRALGVPAVALAGTVLQEAEILHQEGISAYFSICGGPLSLEQAINSGAELLENQAAQVLRLFLAAAGN